MCKIKPIKNIPMGSYCYDENGVCPYWSLDHSKPKQLNGYCAFLEVGNWEQPDGWITLLWDQVKECGQKVKESDPKE